MEETKHKTLPFEKTIDATSFIGKKVLSNDGKKLGRVKSLHLHPQDLTLEGIRVDAGWFEADHYIGGAYIDKMSDDAIVLKMKPVTEYVGLEVYDSNGKKIGKVEKVNRSLKTNKLLSLTVDSDFHDEPLIVTADYINAIGHNVVLKDELDSFK